LRILFRAAIKKSPIFVKSYETLRWILEHTKKFLKHQRFVMARRIDAAALDFHDCLIAVTKAGVGKATSLEEAGLPDCLLDGVLLSTHRKGQLIRCKDLRKSADVVERFMFEIEIATRASLLICNLSDIVLAKGSATILTISK